MIEREVIRRRNLPHWDVPGATYFVTTCLQGSIPAQGLIEIDGYRRELKQRPRPTGMSEAEARRDDWKRVFARVVDALYHFAGQHYDLLGYVVMPSHIHWVFRPREEWVETLSGDMSPRERICRGRNQHTALECNRLLGREGTFWQHESYDHWVRDIEELERILLYVDGNPVKAGLVESPADWQYSSAHDRKRKGLELGQPLTR